MSPIIGDAVFVVSTDSIAFPLNTGINVPINTQGIASSVSDGASATNMSTNMSNTVGNISGIMNTLDLGPTGSLQFQFAKLQLAMAEISKNGALDYMKQIQDAQEEQKKVAAMLQQARQLQADAGAGQGNVSGSKNLTYMPDDMSKYMDKNKLAYDKTGNDLKMNKDEWDVAIQSLQAHLDKLGSNTQQLMVFVQDFMGQYNSYLQGSNSVIQQANQTLAELARAR